MEELRDWLLELNGFSALPGILFLIYIKRQNKVFNAIALILIFSFLGDNLNYFFIRLIYRNSYIINNLWVICNYFVVIWLFYNIMNLSRKLVISLLILFLLGTTISFFFYSLTEANTYIYMFSDASFIVLAVLTFFQLLRQPSQQLSSFPVFWIATSFFLYHSLIFLQSIFNNYLIFDQKISTEAYRLIHIINLLANITKNFILFYTLVLISKGYPDTLKPAKAT